MNYNRQKTGALEDLKQAIIREFTYATPTIDRIFREHVGPTNSQQCCNCGVEMKEEVFVFDSGVGLLLMAMVAKVKEQSISGLDFTAANAISISKLETTRAIKTNALVAEKLGIIAKKKQRGFYAITKKGWEVLRGVPFPRAAVFFMGKQQAGHQENITLRQVMEREGLFLNNFNSIEQYSNRAQYLTG